MKILHISGDDDFHFNTFEQQGDFTIEEIVAECELQDDIVRFEVNDGEAYFDAEVLEFGAVDPEFIDFIKELQDYDDSKNSDWIVLEP